GGASMNQQRNDLRYRPQLIIGTPGRLMDLNNQRALNFAEFNNIVLDEVDRMLDMGFIRDIRKIIAGLPKDRQSLFFSATMTPDVAGVMNTFLRNPVTISVRIRETSTNVDQDIVKIQGKNKVDVLHELLNRRGFDKVLVFGRTKWGIEKLAKELIVRGFRAASLHGNKSLNQRQMALRQFKENKVNILLATDVASRGLDIAGITHVINFDLPEKYEDYIHRIGRTGRADQKGIALSLVD
ncbi:DEAD/DEAH box helicase, partial [Candidatus Curtissbacteria bacterium]|nr:DEAD/DEAH box helicase [Candidatus Curtissbacteria bacterium]